MPPHFRLDTICWLPLDKRSAPLPSLSLCRVNATPTAFEGIETHLLRASEPHPCPSSLYDLLLVLPSFLVSCFALILFTLCCLLVFPPLDPASPPLSVLPLSSAFAFPSSLNIGLAPSPSGGAF